MQGFELLIESFLGYRVDLLALSACFDYLTMSSFKIKRNYQFISDLEIPLERWMSIIIVYEYNTF